jgi:hypothetical protein
MGIAASEKTRKHLLEYRQTPGNGQCRHRSWRLASGPLSSAANRHPDLSARASRGGAMRLLLFFIAALCAAGCQASNPYAVIGPATVPAPTTAQAPPYYPPNNDPAAAPRATAVANTRPSVSAESAPAMEPAAQRTVTQPFVAQPADSQPLRIVENPQAGTRTASAGRGSTPVGTSPSGPLALPPPPTTTPANNSAPRLPGSPQSSRRVPQPAPPAVNRLRGYSATPPASSTTGVMTASYQEPLPGTSPPTPANGAWRAR